MRLINVAYEQMQKARMKYINTDGTVERLHINLYIPCEKSLLSHVKRDRMEVITCKSQTQKIKNTT